MPVLVRWLESAARPPWVPRSPLGMVIDSLTNGSPEWREKNGLAEVNKQGLETVFFLHQKGFNVKNRSSDQRFGLLKLLVRDPEAFDRALDLKIVLFRTPPKGKPHPADLIRESLGQEALDRAIANELIADRRPGKTSEPPR